MYGICTYKAGWFSVEMLANIPHMEHMGYIKPYRTFMDQSYIMNTTIYDPHPTSSGDPRWLRNPFRPRCPHRLLLGTSLPFTRVTPSTDQVLVALRHRIDSPTMGSTSGLDLTKRLSRNRNRCPPRPELTREILRLFFWLHEKMGKWLMGKYGKIGIRSAIISINGKIPIVLGQIYMRLGEIHWNPLCVAGQFLFLNRSCLSNSLLIGCP